jgi:fructose-1,6-bisphosphatase I
VTTLESYLDEGRGPEAAALGALIRAVAAAGVTIADELARAALVGQLGTTGHTNVQGEKVKKLDVWANDVMVAALDATGSACTLVSEEMEKIRHRPEHCAGSRFVVCFDPVDGSSNLDVNGIVGTIFSVSRKRGEGADHASADVL